MLLSLNFSRVMVSASHFPESLEEVDVLHGLGGSTGAQLVKDKGGNLYVMKGGAHPEHIQEESFADDAYRAMGVPVPRSKMYKKQGKPYKLSQFHKGVSLADLKRNNPGGYKRAISELKRNFVKDALLGNWDVLGMHLDNVLITEDGTVLRVDNGGSLRYRAQGAKKSPSQFSDVVSELKSLRDPSVNANSAEVFGSLTDSDIRQQIIEIINYKDRLLKSVPQDIRDILSRRVEYLENYVGERRGGRVF